jgi:ABC-type branched-subunit amino acid transport system permease subunit
VRRALPAAAAIALLLSPLLLPSEFYVNIAAQVLIAAIFALSLNLLVGYGGLISLGAVHYTEVEGTFTGPLFPLGGTRDKILKDTYTFASNFAFNGGYRLGPIGLTLGGAFRIMAPPSEGTHFSMNSGAFWTFDINLGAELGF